MDRLLGGFLSKTLLSRCAWLTPNESEAQFLCGSEFHENEDTAIAKRIQELGARNVVLKQGSRGVFLSTEEGLAARVPGFAVTAIDTTASGDAFNGAFALALVSGRTPQEGGRFANAVAALSVTSAGAQPSMATMPEVQEFARERP